MGKNSVSPMEHPLSSDDDDKLIKRVIRTIKQRFMPFIFLLVQILFVILYFVCTEYDNTAEPNQAAAGTVVTEYYGLFADVTVMVFVGFGFLMTFLHSYSFSAVGFTLLLASFSFQYVILVRGFWHGVWYGFEKIQISLETLINADFGAATVLISFGALLGRTSYIQLLVMALIEVIVYGLNEVILVEVLNIADVGGSLVIHAFGAFFGIAVALVFNRVGRKPQSSKGESSIYHSDVFAMIGTMFLFIYWPSFNGALAGNAGNARHRAVINTILSLTTSGSVTFFMSTLLNGQLSMVDVQNATLAGGVAIGGSANMRTQPGGAMLVGLIAGILSTVFFNKVTPLLKEKNILRDTCGVLSLHGMPGLLGGFASAIFASMSSSTDYDIYLYDGLFSDGTRSAGEQAGYQLLAIPVTLGCALVGGLVTGLVMKLPMFLPVESEYDDAESWEVPGFAQEMEHQL